MPKNSILAGIFISLGCITYIQVENKYLGALLFSLGLLSVCINHCSLYTGMAGFCRTANDFKRLIDAFCGNIVGCAIVVVLSFFIIDPDKAQSIAASKMATPYVLFFLKSIFCGGLMYVGVRCYQSMRVLGTVMAVMVFILCGFEHSIADAFYFFAGNTSLANIPLIVCMICVAALGNLLGALGLSYLNDEAPKQSRK